VNDLWPIWMNPCVLRHAGASRADNSYFGKLIGSIESDTHGIRGDVYAVDARTLFIKGFTYDGQSDAVFYAGSSPRIGPNGFVIPDEDGSWVFPLGVPHGSALLSFQPGFIYLISNDRTESLSKAYRNRDLTLTLPEGKTLKEVRWVALWSNTFTVHSSFHSFVYSFIQSLLPFLALAQQQHNRFYPTTTQAQLFTFCFSSRAVSHLSRVV